MIVKFKRLTSDAKTPKKSGAKEAGHDLYSSGDWDLEPGKLIVIPLGIATQLPNGSVALIMDRSGLAIKGITTKVVAACPDKFIEYLKSLGEFDGLLPFGGVIDETYRGEWKVILYNATSALPIGDKNPDGNGSTIHITKGDRIAQAVILTLAEINESDWKEVETLDDSERGTNGFGSSGS